MKCEIFLMALVLVFCGSSSANEQNEREALLEKISTTIAEVTWTGKHNQPGDHKTIMELLVNETVKRVGPEIKRLGELLAKSDAQTVVAVTERLTAASVKKVESLEKSHEDPLAPRCLLCMMQRGVLGGLATGVSGSIGGLLGLMTARVSPLGLGVGGCGLLGALMPAVG